MTYLHKASRCLKILFGGGMMGQGSVGTFNGHSPLYLNLLHRMRDPMTITDNHGKAAAGEPFWGCSATYLRFKMVEFDRGKHGLQSAWASMFMFLSCWPRDTLHLQMEPMVSARQSNTSNKNSFSLQQTSCIFCPRDSHRGMVVY